MEKITLLKYSNTNTYLVEGDMGSVLFDTGWAGTFQNFCSELGRNGKQLKNIEYILISHFHPDHYGIAQEIADKGPVILAADVQKDYLHASDPVFEKDKKIKFYPIRDDKVRIIPLEESRKVLSEIGISGELFYTPGHSDDSISLWLDKGDLVVGDLNPLYELELHRGTEIEQSWNKLMTLNPRTVYYGHAKTAVLGQPDDQYSSDDAYRKDMGTKSDSNSDYSKWYNLVSAIMKYIDKGWTLDRIVRKTGADSEFVETVTRMYLTHTNVGVQGILDRIEIKNK